MRGKDGLVTLTLALSLQGRGKSVVGERLIVNKSAEKIEGELAGGLEGSGDSDVEKLHLEDTQRAVLNILEDFDSEKSNLEETQKATLNVLEDFDSEKVRLESAQRAVLNILEDFEDANAMLQFKSAELNLAN